MVVVSFGLRNEWGPGSAPGPAKIFPVLPPSAFLQAAEAKLQQTYPLPLCGPAGEVDPSSRWGLSLPSVLSPSWPWAPTSPN